MDEAHLREELEALFVNNQEFGELESGLNVFCPFEAIGMVDQEIRHSKFLSHCLNPTEAHGFGVDCLRALMRAAAGAVKSAEDFQGRPIGGVDFIDPLGVHLMNLENAKVMTEWNNIDLVVVVEGHKLVVAIELKINAKEHGDQLTRYKRYVERAWPESDGWKSLLLFLTKNEASPSDQSWVPLGLKRVVEELDVIARRGSGIPDANLLLRSYLGMMRRNHLSNERLEKLAADLWAQHPRALEFLRTRKPGGIFSDLAKRHVEIADVIARESGLDVDTADSQSSIIRFAVTQWDKIPGFLNAQGWTKTGRSLLIEIKPYRNGAIRIAFVLGPNADLRDILHESLTRKGLGNMQRGEKSSQYSTLDGENLINAPKGSESVKMEDEAIDRVIAAIASFAKSKIRAYDEAFRDSNLLVP